VTTDFDISEPDVVIRFDAPDEDQRRRGLEGEFRWGQVDSDLVLRSGTIRLFPEIIRESRIGELPEYIANLTAHEMGHALGVQKHSPESTDLMSGVPPRNFTHVSYPWVTRRDLNTMLGDYCRAARLGLKLGTPLEKPVALELGDHGRRRRLGLLSSLSP